MVRKVVGGGPKALGFVQSIGGHRKAVVGDAAADGAKRPSEAQARPLTAAGLAGKLVDLHWPHLAGTVKSAATLTEAQSKLYGNAARIYGRAWESAQKVVAQQLSALPEGERTKVATRTFAALARLVDEAGEAALPSALAAASGLIDAALRMKARGTVALDVADVARLAEDAAGAVLSLLDLTRDRRGQSSMLNALPRFVEQLELVEGKIGADRSRAIVEKVVSAIAAGTPKGGTDFAELSAIAALLTKHAKAGKKAETILDRAFSEAAGSRKAAIDVARGGLDGSPIGLALGRLLDANPTAPDGLLAAVEQLVAAARQNAAHEAAIAHAGAILSRFAEGPAGETIARTLGLHLGVLALGAADLEAAAGARTDGAAAAGLVRAFLAGAGLDANPFDAGLRHLEKLSPAGAARVAAVLTDAIAGGRGSPELLTALVDRAKAERDDDPLAALESHAQAHCALSRELAAYPILQGDPKLAAAIVGACGAEHLPRLVRALATVKQALPGARLEKLIGADAFASGLAALASATDRVNDPMALFSTLLEDARRFGAEDPDGITRSAIRVALEASGIFNGEAAHFPRILEDWRLALADPGALTYVARGKAVDLRAARTIAGFLSAHPELPADLAFTAGRLSEARLAWVIGKLGESHEAARHLRDAIFGLTAIGRLDVLDALAASKSPPAAVSAVLKELAGRFQRQDLGNAPVDEIVQGLAAGADPIAAIREREVKAAFQATDLYALAEGKVTDAGLAEIVAIAGNVADLIVQYSPGFQVWSCDAHIDMTKLLDPYLAAVKDTLQGTWPKRKYEDEVGVRQLGILTPEQRVIWRRNMVTFEQDADVQPVPVDPRVVTLALGLSKGLAKELRLEHAEIPNLEWDAESKQRLAAMRDEILPVLRASPKGSEEHKAASRRIGPIMDRLRVIELKLALDALAGEKDPATIARALAPVIEPALGSIRKLGGRGCAEAAAKIVASLPIVAPRNEAAPSGAYAIDEDSLTAMIDSHKSGCLSYGDQRRRWGMCGSLTDANTKMLHTYRDGVQKYRAFLRLLPVKLPSYEGPALYIESPVGDTGGDHTDHALLAKGLFAKARAMGIPAIGAGAAAPQGWSYTNVHATLTFDWGHTGVYHSDRLGNVTEQGNGGLPVTREGDIDVAIPPELAARIAV